MQIWKKFSAVALALVMSLALCAPAFASTNVTLNDGSSDSTLKGQAGTFSTEDSKKDVATSQSKVLLLKKEITAYNVDTTTINAPTISYTYTIAPATVAAGTQVTDNADKHNSGEAVTFPVSQPTAGEGNANLPTIDNNGVVAWTPDVSLNAGTDGVANYKDISIDFTNVVFSAPGIYRYEITETLTSGYTYASSGVTQTTATTIPDGVVLNKRYIDVYVQASKATTETATETSAVYTNGLTAAQWDIYGYTCFCKNTSITDDNKDDTAVKTIGFVAGTTNGSVELKADSYYTYNVTVSKTVENDNYAKKNHAFPFTVIFTNSAVTKNIDIKADASTVTTTETTAFKDPAVGALSAGNTKGIIPLKDGERVKYIGIPCGTTVEVYETNNLTGSTYKVDTVVDGTTSSADDKSDAAVIADSAPSEAVTQAMSGETKTNAYESTKVTFTPTVDTDDDTDHSVAITNTLLNISPTGVTLRYAPYLAMMGAGIVALPLSLRKKEEEI